MRSWWRVLQVAVITKTNRFAGPARQSQVSPPRTHYDRGWESHPVVFNWERRHGGCLFKGSRRGYGIPLEKKSRETTRFLDAKASRVSRQRALPLSSHKAQQMLGPGPPVLRRQALKMPRTNRAVTFAGLIPLISPTNRLAHQFLIYIYIYIYIYI